MGSNKTVMSQCHPERLHKAKGLCGSCYNMNNFSQNAKNNPELLLKKKEMSKKVYKRNIQKDPHYSKKVNLKLALRRAGIPIDKRRDIFNELYNQSDRVCEICGQKETSARKDRLCIDHDHSTKEYRGLLCNCCNRAIGFFRDNIETMKAAIQYLEKAAGTRGLEKWQKEKI